MKAERLHSKFGIRYNVDTVVSFHVVMGAFSALIDGNGNFLISHNFLFSINDHQALFPSTGVKVPESRGTKTLTSEIVASWDEELT